MANPFTPGAPGPAGPWDPRNPHRPQQNFSQRWQRFTRVWSNNWRLNGPNITQVIVALNLLVFVAQEVLKLFPVASATFTSYTALISGYSLFYPWTLLTSAFMHTGFTHILMNMLILYFVGKELEKLLGHRAFLSMYLISALGGSVAYVLWHGAAISAVMGASGAIYGLFGAMMTVYNRIGSRSQGMLLFLFIMLFVPIFFGNVAWQAHLGGFITGAALSTLMMRGLPIWRSASINKRMAIYGTFMTVLLLIAWSARLVFALFF